MPQRHRPRLKQTAITCSWCGISTVKLYPSRESVRRKLSPYRFCSSTCQRDHWEARRKAEWSVAPYPCAQCGTAITPQQAAGRRRSYCNDTCKQKAARERRRRNPRRRGDGGSPAIQRRMALGGQSRPDAVRVHRLREARGERLQRGRPLDTRPPPPTRSGRLPPSQFGMLSCNWLVRRPTTSRIGPGLGMVDGKTGGNGGRQASPCGGRSTGSDWTRRGRQRRSFGRPSESPHVGRKRLGCDGPDLTPRRPPENE